MSRAALASHDSLNGGTGPTDLSLPLSDHGNGSSDKRRDTEKPTDPISGDKARKKKLNKLRTFMNVFVTGIRHQPSVYGSHDVARESKVNSKHQQLGQDLSVSQSIDFSPNLNSEDPQLQLEVHGGGPCPLPDAGVTPGLCGLHNQGNTCFMNAILQCLSNTDQLAEYMVTDQYKNDINKQKVSLRSFSSYGAVTEQFAVLLKCLWSGQCDGRVMVYFKDVIGRHASQYQGSSQHDAQEFFLWLLDNVHEDLNLAGKKKYRPRKVSSHPLPPSPQQCYASTTLHLSCLTLGEHRQT